MKNNDYAKAKKGSLFVFWGTLIPIIIGIIISISTALSLYKNFSAAGVQTMSQDEIVQMAAEQGTSQELINGSIELIGIFFAIAGLCLIMKAVGKTKESMRILIIGFAVSLIYLVVSKLMAAKIITNVLTISMLLLAIVYIILLYGYHKFAELKFWNRKGTTGSRQLRTSAILGLISAIVLFINGVIPLVTESSVPMKGRVTITAIITFLAGLFAIVSTIMMLVGWYNIKSGFDDLLFDKVVEEREERGESII